MTTTPMIPGQMLVADGEIEMNVGRATCKVTVANTGDRPVQIGSHYHFAETNAALRFDRQAARGFRLNIPAGTAVRFEPGQEREVELVALGGDRIVFAYSLAGLLLGYVYFSIPRTLLTLMAAAEKLDPRLEEAARSLGASPFGVLRDVLLPGIAPALAAAGAICFATATGAFGTAFALASRIDVLPMVIYTEFTLQANLAVAAALSFLLGIATWAVLAVARGASGGAAA